MNFYTPDNPPKSGNAKRIWSALIQAGFKVRQLHYNSNCWGRGKDMGWGTWAFDEDVGDSGHWCGISQGQVYVQKMGAPYQVVWLKMTGQKYRATRPEQHENLGWDECTDEDCDYHNDEYVETGGRIK